MAMSKLLRKKQAAGFAMIEAVIAIAILAVGLLGIAALLAQLGGNSTLSRYMSTESLLASEKLDDLNRYPFNDPAIAVPNGVSAGSLTADSTNNTVTIGAVTEVVDYCDQVSISSGNGNMSETVSGTDANGNQQYTTTTHAPDGSINVVKSAAAPAQSSDMLTFSRRWTIELSPAGVPPGVRRFTVWVSQKNAVKPSSFQSSMLR